MLFGTGQVTPSTERLTAGRHLQSNLATRVT